MLVEKLKTERSGGWRITACRACGCQDLPVVLNLGDQPIANALLNESELDKPEPIFPLQVVFCSGCGLLQVGETIPPEVLFGGNYPYFSSFIPELLAHSRAHALALIEERGLGAHDFVVEIASNDGYLLRNFVEFGIPVLGIDPAQGPVEAAIAAGVPTEKAFFGIETARRIRASRGPASLVLANNVLAHVSDVNDFVGGFAVLLADDGIAEFEFPYVRDLVDSCAFDTIYHEHVFYYSLVALEALFARNGLHLNDVIKLTIHGGSLRLRVSKAPGASDRLAAMLAQERELGLDRLDYYMSFAQRVSDLRDALRSLLVGLKNSGSHIAAYGAAAKGATLLNYIGLPAGTLDFVVDRNPHKVGKFMPGVHVPIAGLDALEQRKPDYLLVLAWNFINDIVIQQKAFSEQGGRIICPIPFPRLFQPE